MPVDTDIVSMSCITMPRYDSKWSPTELRSMRAAGLGSRRSSFRRYATLLLNRVTSRRRSDGLVRGTCLRCGATWEVRAVGRPRKWCSQRCRRAAYEERRAAAAGAIAVREVKVPEAQTEHDLTACVDRVADSPAACRRLLQRLARAEHLARLFDELPWDATREAVLSLADQVQRERQRRRPRRW